MVNERHIGDDFVHFLQSIDQPCVVIFDEFEKVYSYEEQAALLTMFDGTMSSKKLWILTCNHQHNVNEFIGYAAEYKEKNFAIAEDVRVRRENKEALELFEKNHIGYSDEVSEAVGKYQMVPETFREGIKKLGISTSEIFEL
jgi:hypothetical protein